MTNMNNVISILNKLNMEELESLKQKVAECIASKRETKQFIYTHDCYGSSNYHFRKYKHFAKLLTANDDTKTNGFAFIGEFLRVDKEDLVKCGSYIVEVCDCSISLYKVEKDGINLILEGNSRRYVGFIQEAKRLTGL